MSKITVSVIIPHYNSPNKLRRLLWSIPKASDIQIIVIDDLSTEGVETLSDIKKEFSYVDFYDNTKDNKSAGGARNIGLEYAKGEWLLFADADDIFLPNAWNLVRKYALKNVDLIYFSPCAVMEDSFLPSERSNYYIKTIKKYRYFPISENKLAIKYTMYSPCSKLVRKSIVDKNNIRFSCVMYSNDVMFSVKVGHFAKRIIAVEKNIYCVTQGKNTLRFNPDSKQSYIRKLEQDKVDRWLDKVLSKDECNRVKSIRLRN